MSATDRPETQSDRPALAARLDRLALVARAALLWERVWPVLAGLLCVLGLFLTLSWLGLWIETPRWGRIAGGLAFLALTLAALAQGLRLRWPGRREALSRLDRDSGVAHRPATTLADQPANASGDPETAALWAVHRRRAEAAAQALRVAAPSPRLVDRDAFALRAAILAAACGAAFVAGPQKYARVAAAFDWRTEGALAQGFRLDAWIDPPAYTGRPPVLLQTKAGDEKAAAILSATARRIEAPFGSTVVVRSSGDAGVIVETEGALTDPAGEKNTVKADGAPAPKAAPVAKASSPNADTEQRLVLKGDSRLVLKRGGRVVAAFDLISIPDRPPTIALTEPAKTNVRGSLSLAYKIGDDYGVASAEARFAKPRINGRAVTGRALVEPPRLGLQLPQAPGGLGEGQTTGDLSEHPWAGARVALWLTAKDEGGNEGRSEESEITLPQRAFTKPMARALVEQRRNLVLAPDEMKGRVMTALDALKMEPELFGTTAAVYLGLSLAQTKLRVARSDADLVGVADFLWEMALRIEDGDLSQSERELRAAQQALREALQRGASPEELKKLMQDLRAAMDKFLRDFAEQQMRDMQRGDRNDQDRVSPQDRMMSQQDLNSMLDRMEEMAKRGETADAQRMLDQLQRMMENLQAARPNRDRNSASRELNKQMSELDKLMREQQKLRDDTFRQDQKQRRSGRDGQRQQRQQRGQQPGDPSDPGDQDMADNDSGGGDEMSPEELQKQQKALRERLEELKRRMKQLGMNGEKGLDEAEDAMKEAENELGDGQDGQDGQQGQQGKQGQGQQGNQQGQQGKGGKGRNPGKAVDAQGRALEALRRGQQGLAQQMQRQPGQGDGDPEMADGDDWGEPDPNGQPRRADGTNRDPLDRPRRDNGNRLNDYTGMNAGPGAAERARRVLEELQRRLSDPNRPREELDYLERLLRRY